MDDARCGDQLVGWIATHVKARACLGDLTSQGPDVNARQNPDDLGIVQVNFDSAQLCELGDLPEHNRGDAPASGAEQVGLAQFERTRDRVEQDVRVNVQHAN